MARNRHFCRLPQPGITRNPASRGWSRTWIPPLRGWYRARVVLPCPIYYPVLLYTLPWCTLVYPAVPHHPGYTLHHPGYTTLPGRPPGSLREAQESDQNGFLKQARLIPAKVTKVDKSGHSGRPARYRARCGGWTRITLWAQRLPISLGREASREARAQSCHRSSRSCARAQRTLWVQNG